MTVAFKSPVTSANVNAKFISRTDNQNASGNINFVNGIQINGITLDKASGILDVGDTGGIKIPDGTTGQRPTAGNGVFRYNTTNNKFEGYENGSWTNFIGSANARSFRAATTTDSITTADDTVSYSGASFTATLPTAVGNSGKRFTIIHAGTSLTQVYTLNTTSGQTIGGVASGSYKLITNGEALTIESDGSNWAIVEHKTQTSWTDGGTITITAETSNPTKGTLDIDKFWWRRVGSDIYLKYQYTQTALGSAAAGTGNYIFALPITVNTTVIPAVGGVLDSDMVATTNLKSIIGRSFVSNSGSRGAGIAILRTSTSFCITGQSEFGSGTGPVSSSFFGLNNANTSYHVEIGPLPVTDWQP